MVHKNLTTSEGAVGGGLHIPSWEKARVKCTEALTLYVPQKHGVRREEEMGKQGDEKKSRGGGVGDQREGWGWNCNLVKRLLCSNFM